MPVLVVGEREIEYDVHQSPRARRKRIEVTPGQVRVIVPEGTSPTEVKQFVRSRRRWIHDRTETLAEKIDQLRTPIGYHSGAKVLFRGRYLKLRVEPAAVDEAQLTYQTSFHISVPEELRDGEREQAVQRVLKEWFRDRLREDAWGFIRRHGHPNGLEPRDVRVKKQKTLWGSCGKDRVLRLDEKLIRVPKPVLEYVIVHELCHLRFRDHSGQFWSLLKAILPDYEARKRWLEEHEVRVT